MPTIGVVGSGKLSAKMIRATFDDQLEAAGDPTELLLLLPVAKGVFSKGVETVADWALTNGVPFEVVIDATAEKIKVAEEFLETAMVEHKTKKSVPEKLVKILAEEEDDAKLFVFWDEDDEEGYIAFDEAWETDIPAYDLCNGLERLTFDEGEDEPEEPEDEPEEEEQEPEDVDPAAELARKTSKVLKEELENKGVTINRKGKGRIGKPALISATIDHEETGHLFYLQEEDGGEAVRVDPDGEPTEDIIDQEILDEIASATAPVEDAEEPEAEEPEEKPKPKKSKASKPEPEEEADGIPTAGPEETVQYKTSQVPTMNWQIVASCSGCGGPVFARPDDNEDPEVRWEHAEGCPVK